MKRGMTPMKTPSKLRIVGNTDALQVFCRIRPIDSPADIGCIKIISDTTVQLTSPETAVNFRNGIYKETQYTFKRVFSEISNQKAIFDEVGLPLVDQLIRGRNGLLFTYGVTGSGKTYTMTGTSKDGGIMPRCLDVIFNSINDLQSDRYVFKPDRMNGFEVQTQEDARRELEEINGKNLRNGRLKKKDSEEDLLSVKSARVKDDTKVNGIEEDNAYAVFVTYIEIYNNSVFDLLENISERDVCTRFQAKIIREDASRNMYVHGVTEVEVKDADEAFEIFSKGQKRKRMAHTTLNTESSRSHSIFTIRLVQAPLDIRGENVLQEKKFIGISQLSLVDLAGSERTNRTNNCDQRLKEAGKINNSLMTLRNCLDILRENQMSCSNKIIPYRESKLTHLFKNYFDGEGDIRMLVCVNPREDDYDETVQVMKFAEVSQDIQVQRGTPYRTPDLALTPGRRKLNQKLKTTLKKLVEDAKDVDNTNRRVYVPDSIGIDDLGLIYSLPEFPRFDSLDPFDEETNKTLMSYLEERIKRMDALKNDLSARATCFRNSLLEHEKNLNQLQFENNSLKAIRDQDMIKIRNLNEKIALLDGNYSSCKRKLNEMEQENKRLKSELYQTKADTYLVSNKRKLRELEIENKRLKSELKSGEKENSEPDSNSSSGAGLSGIPISKSSGYHSAVSNPRHRRSKSVDRWLHHQSKTPVPLDTVFQPVLKRRKSFSQVTSPEQIKQMSRYCLMTQNQHANGDLETCLVKGNIIPTAGGGAQIIYDDVETLRQTSPVTSPVKKIVNDMNRKNNTPRLYPDIERKCSVSIEGHASKRH